MHENIGVRSCTAKTCWHRKSNLNYMTECSRLVTTRFMTHLSQCAPCPVSTVRYFARLANYVIKEISMWLPQIKMMFTITEMNNLFILAFPSPTPPPPNDYFPVNAHHLYIVQRSSSYLNSLTSTDASHATHWLTTRHNDWLRWNHLERWCCHWERF